MQPAPFLPRAQAGVWDTQGVLRVRHPRVGVQGRGVVKRRKNLGPQRTPSTNEDRATHSTKSAGRPTFSHQLPPSSLQREPSIVAGVPEDGGRRTQRRRQVRRQPNPLPLILLHHVHPFIPRPRRSRAQVGPSSAKRASEKNSQRPAPSSPYIVVSPPLSHTPTVSSRGV